MPTWKEVTSNPDYQDLSFADKVKTKNEFFINVISRSQKFINSTSEQQQQFKNDFYNIPPEEDLGFAKEPTTPLSIAKETVNQFQKFSPFRVVDQPVEQIAQMVDAKVPAGRTVPGLLLKDLPRQMVAETIRGVKPSAIGTYYLATKALSPVGKYVVSPSAKFVGKYIPQGIKTAFTRNLTVGRGQPIAYQEFSKATALEKQAGAREAEQVAKTLNTKPSGEVLTAPEQQYMGRIFRNEIDLGSQQSRLSQLKDPELITKINKDMEVNIAFNPKIQSLNKELETINKTLRNKEELAKSLIGKEFRTETGFIEKATGVSKTPRVGKSGKQLKPEIGVETSPVVPKVPTQTNIPQEMFPSDVIERKLVDVSSGKTTNDFINLSRKDLLKRRKNISEQLQQEMIDTEVKVRSKYDLFNKEFSEQILAHPKYQELKAISDEGRLVMDKWSTELANSGIPKEETKQIIEENIGKYMPRMFKERLNANVNRSMSTGELQKASRLKLGMLKHRKDLSDEVLRQLGEIKEPAFPVSTRVLGISENIANNKLFTKVASNPEWVSNTNVTGKMIKMPDSATVGVLRNKYVIPEIAEDINAITSAKKQNLYAKFMSAWKYGKVVLNPASQVRNALSNTILLDLSGTSHIRQAQLFPKVFSEYLGKGKLYQQALEDGTIGGEFIGGEIKKLRDFYTKTQGSNFEKWISMIRTPFDKAGKLYQGMEQSAKLLKYIDVLENTGNRQLAAKEAQKWLFNYNEVPKVIDFSRKYLSPFITFTYKSVPRIGETLVNRPMALYKYKVLFDSINETSRKYQGMLPHEYARQKRLLPDWLLKDVGGVPANLLMPWKDKYGRTQWLNLEYILPLGQSPEIAEQGILKGFINNPLINLYSDLSKNQDFKGQAIVPIGATPREAIKAKTKHIYNQLVPNLAGISANKIINAIKQTPDYAGRTRNIPTVLADTLSGLKLTPLDVNEAETFRMWEKKKMVDELKKQVFKLNHPAISEKERNRKTEELFKKMQDVMNSK